MRFFSDLRLANKIVLLVALLGALALFVVLNLITTVHSLEQDFRTLNIRHGATSQHLNNARLDLVEAKALVFSALTIDSTAEIEPIASRLSAIEADFINQVEKAHALSIKPTGTLGEILERKTALFNLAHELLNALPENRQTEARLIAHQKFAPNLDALRRIIEDVDSRLQEECHLQSDQLAEASDFNLMTTTLCLIVIIIVAVLIAAWFSVTEISRPITCLVEIMGRLSLHNYDDRIVGAERKDEVGEMARAIGVFRNTLRKLDCLEIKLVSASRAEKLSELLVDLTTAMPGTVFRMILRPDGTRRYLFLSNHPGQFLSYPTVQVLGRDISSSESLAKEVEGSEGIIIDRLSQAAKTLEPLDFDVQLEQEGKRIWAKMIASVRRLEDGSALFNGVWLNITEAKKQAQALEEAREEREKAVRARSEFLAVVSHEIRTPINAILGLTKLSLKHESDPHKKERIKRILRAGARLARTVNDILDFSKIEEGHFEIEQILFEPQALVQEVQELMSERAFAKGLSLSFHLADNLPPRLLGDPSRINQILLNYVANAIKFSETGSIDISLYPLWQGGALYLGGEVEDHGIGIDESAIGRLFQPFQQAAPSITRKFGGTGLGLAISHRLAELMGGEVGVKSRPGVGSTFWFRVRVEMPGAEQLSSIRKTEEPGFVDMRLYQGQRLLVVDDNELNRVAGRDILEDAGFVVDVAENGEEAIGILEQAKDGTYDAVLMDVMMPEMDGYTATRTLRANPRFADLPIIAMTASVSHDDVARCREAGMSAHLAKPVNDRLLWRVLGDLLTPRTIPATLESPLSRPSPEDDKEMLGLSIAQLALFESNSFDQLFTLTSPERFDELTSMLKEEIEALAKKIAVLTEERNFAGLDHSIHDIISINGQSSMKRLVEVARLFRATIRNGDEELALHLAAMIPDLARDSAAALQNYRLLKKESLQKTAPKDAS